MNLLWLGLAASAGACIGYITACAMHMRKSADLLPPGHSVAHWCDEPDQHEVVRVDYLL